jgi:hypothetical protein
VGATNNKIDFSANTNAPPFAAPTVFHRYRLVAGTGQQHQKRMIFFGGTAP